MTTVTEIVARGLRRHGVRFVLGQSVPSALVLACADAGIAQVTYRQENMGGAMADGFARVSGRIPVFLCQNGPAAALAVAPLAEARAAGTPIVALVREVDRGLLGRNAFQEFDHRALLAPVAKWFRRLESAQGVEDHLDAAFAAAGSGRPGPAVLMLPQDLHAAPAEQDPRRRADLGAWPADRPRPAARAVEQLADLIAGARAPVVLAGGGVHASQAQTALAELQERASLPVLTTNMGKGAVIETHPLSAGPLASLTGPGSLGRHTRDLLADADAVLVIGSRMNEDATDKWTLVPGGATIAHIDIDPMEVGRNYESIRLVADAREALGDLLAALARRDLSRRDQARAGLEDRIARAWAAFEHDRAPMARSTQAPARPERVLAAVQQAVDDDTVIAADASYASNWVAGQLTATHAGTRFITPRGLAGLGWGMPLGMGAKLARPEATVIAVVGDGGFGHSWAELETAVRHGIAITVIVLNNAVLGYQKDAEQVKFGRYTSSGHLGRVDHAAIARACGAHGVTVTSPGDLQDAIAAAVSAGRPALIDVITDPGAHPPLSLYDNTLDVVHDDGTVTREPVP